MSKKTYLNFDLFVEPIPDGYRARVDSPAGQARVNFSLPLLKQELEERNKKGLKAVGSYLYDQIFQKELHTCLHNSRSYAERQKKGLRIRLRLDSAEVAALPWEYLYDKTVGGFFCLSNQTPLVRYIELPQREKSLLVEPPLKVLVMISTPIDLPPLDVEQELDGLLQAVSKLEQEGLLNLKLVTNATIKALQDELQDNEYHIFHFIGHGIFDPWTQQGMIIFENENKNKKSQPISAQRLGVLLHDSPIRLALLNSCQGARTSQSHLFAGVAQNLVQQGIPAVIAMQFNIQDPTAIRFAHEFYKVIGKEFPIDAALAEARKALPDRYGQGIGVEWGTPVLYMRAPDGRLFDIEQTIEAALPALPHGELQLPFVNRKCELKFICDSESPQHIQIYAPSGYGKTELLQEVKARYQQKGWQVVWLDFSSPEQTGCAENKLALLAEVARQSGLEQLTSQTPTDAVRELARHWMQKRKQTLLLFDSLEYVSDSQMLAWMKKQLFRPLAQKYIPVPKIRPKVVAVGRIRVPKWGGYPKPHFHLHRLTAFDDLTIIDQLLGNLVQDFEMPSEWFDGMSKEIMQLTKGHPKCITNLLLSFLAQENFSISVQYFIEERPQIYHNYVKPILENEILVAVRKDEFLYQMLLIMSVLRGMNLSVIQYLKQQGLIRKISPSPGWARTLFGQLVGFGLLEKKNPLMHSWEKMIRQLLALQLSLTDQQLYWTVHEVAAKMIDEWIRGEDESGQPHPIPLRDNMQTDAIREGLYHHAQLFARASRFTVASQLEAKLKNAYLPYLRTSLGQDVSGVAALLLKALQEDSELKNLVVSMAGEDAFARLLEPVRELAEH